MSDLPPIGETLKSFLQQVASIRRGGSREEPKPHKLVLLLAVLDCMDRGLFLDNRVPFSKPLTTSFELIFFLTCGPGDWCLPAEPFFHLRSSPFWHHKVRADREAEYAALDTAGGGRQRIHDTIEYAYFSPEVHMVLLDPSSRATVKRHLIERLNPSARSAMQKSGYSEA